jgi:hypothetical protein
MLLSELRCAQAGEEESGEATALFTASVLIHPDMYSRVLEY